MLKLDYYFYNVKIRLFIILLLNCEIIESLRIFKKYIYNTDSELNFKNHFFVFEVLDHITVL